MRKRFYSPGKIQPGDEYVIFKGPLCMGAVTLNTGDPVDVSALSRIRVRQLVEWKKIIPRRLFEDVSGMKLSEKAATKVSQGARGRDLFAQAPAKPKPKPVKEPEDNKAPKKSAKAAANAAGSD